MKKQTFSKEALEAYNALMNLSEEKKQLVFSEVSQSETPEPVKTSKKRSHVVHIVEIPM